MRIDKLDEEKLNEFRDFCRYGYCLEEETAKEYLNFLVNGIKSITDKYKTISADTAHKINNKRFRNERTRDDRIDNDYFESFSGKEGTLSEFETEFEYMFNQLKIEKDDKGKRKIPQEWITWIQSTFNDYVCRFDKRDPSIKADFADEVNWKDKGRFTGSHLPSSAKKLIVT